MVPGRSIRLVLLGAIIGLVVWNLNFLRQLHAAEMANAPSLLVKQGNHSYASSHSSPFQGTHQPEYESHSHAEKVPKIQSNRNLSVQEMTHLIQLLKGQRQRIKSTSRVGGSFSVKHIFPSNQTNLSAHDYSSVEQWLRSLVVPPTTNKKTRATNHDTVKLVFRANSGLGHFLLRMANAHYIARSMGLSEFWIENGKQACGANKLFDFLFGSDSLAVYQHNPSRRQQFNPITANASLATIQFNNEVPNFSYKMKAIREGGNQTGPLCTGKVESDYALFHQLQLRYESKFSSQTSRMNRFLESVPWNNHTVLGIHIRAGNGESSDFSVKRREILDVDRWIENVCFLIARYRDHVLDLAARPLLVFLATDTGSVVQPMRLGLQAYNVSMVTVPQIYLDEGASIGLYSQDASEAKCLEKWESMWLDMLLLARSDILWAGQYSSFTQSLPLSFIFGRQQFLRSVNSPPFCEVGQSGDVVYCFASFEEWHSSSHTLVVGNIQGIPPSHPRLIMFPLAHPSPTKYPLLNERYRVLQTC